MKYLKEMVLTPADAILKAKRQKNLNRTLLILVKEWIFIAVAILIANASIGQALIGAGFAILTFVFGVLATLFYGVLIKKIMVTLGGKGKFYEGLTAKVYAIFPLSVGILIASILSLVPVIGSVLVFIVIAISAVLSLAALYRGIKELFGVDLITAWIAIGILIFGTFVAFYLTLFLTVGGNLTELQQLLAQSRFPMR